jgi:membrane-bound lytic murein transglycosylase A
VIEPTSLRACAVRGFWVIIVTMGLAVGALPASASSTNLKHAFARIKLALASPGPSMPTSSMTLSPVAFADLPGWESDDHLAAWKVFLSSCPTVIARAGKTVGATPDPQALVHVCRAALAAADAGKQTKAGAKAFFESHFRPQSVGHDGAEGLLTGYYEPLLAGSRVRSGAFQTPIYRRPPDLVNMVAESDRGAKSAQLTHMRKTDGGLEPYLTRAQIEQGALKNQGLELMYFRDPVDVFFMQIQGSGRVELPDGSKVRVSYAGKNGYPYTSIGRALISDGAIEPSKMSLKALKAWLRADRERGRKVMWQNKSYVFFRELSGKEGDGAVGALGTPLVAGRSLAVDTAFHSLGIPIYVCAATLTHAEDKRSRKTGFARLMIAQDVGSAIKGPERGDIYFGSGNRAGRIAGTTKNAGRFFVLLPQEEAPPQIFARQR